MSVSTDTKIVKMAIADAQGYSPAQVRNTMTLFDLQQAIAEAIEKYGDDAMIVTDNGDRYGATFGGIDSYRDLFVPVVELVDCGACGAEYNDDEENDGHCPGCGAYQNDL